MLWKVGYMELFERAGIINEQIINEQIIHEQINKKSQVNGCNTEHVKYLNFMKKKIIVRFHLYETNQK